MHDFSAEGDRSEVDNELRRKNIVLDAINRVFWEALTCESEADVAKVCLAVAEELTQSKFGFLGEENEEGRFDTIALSDPGWEACRIAETQAVVLIRDMEIRGIWAKPMLREESVIVNDPDCDPDRVGIPGGHPPLTCFLGVPLKQAGKTVGVIALANREGGYDEGNRGDIEALAVAFVEALYRKRAEIQLKKHRDRLGELVRERVKELKCLYDVSQIVTRSDISFPGILREVVNLLPPAWRYHDITCARITFEGKEFKTDNFNSTQWRQSADIEVHGKKAGTVEVYYREEKPDVDEGPFVREERELIDAIADRLGATVQRRRAEESLRRSQRELNVWNRIAEIFLTTPDEETYGKVLRAVLDALESRYGTFGYIDEIGDLIVPSMTRDVWEKCQVQREDKIRFVRGQWGHSIWPEAIRQKKMLYSNEPSVLAPEGHVRILRNITLPIIYGDEVIGLLQVANKRTDYDQQDLALLQSIGDRVAPVLKARLQRGRHEGARKRAEEALLRSRAELSRSNADLEQFAHVASHELQEPLRMVASYVQLLAARYRDKLDCDAEEFIDFAADGAKRMQRLIDDLLGYSRVGTQGRAFQPVDCNDVADEAVHNLRVAATQHGAVVTRDQLPTISGDRSQLTQLIQNLIANAIKFHADEPPRIHIAADESDRQWTFSVRDNGIGIDPQYQERIFRIFQRLHTRQEYPGTGIGLAVCKRIVDRHGGRIWCESESGKGATFYFTLPEKGAPA